MKKRMLLGAVFVLLLVVSACKQTEVEANFQVIPLPQSILVHKTPPFILDKETSLLYPDGNEKMAKNAAFLAAYLEERTNLSLVPVLDNGKTGKAIALKLGLQAENPEAYQLTVDENRIVIQGASEAGVFHGIQTLRKALPDSHEAGRVVIPATTVNDYPRFTYRGAHLDVCRHFFSVDEVKTYLDMMALHNMNELHWHISDDQGWRIEIKRYPKLTQIGSRRAETLVGHLNDRPEQYDGKPYGGFYTQEEAKEIVRYAADRYINVIPEIDLPGHMQAALAAYPELGCTGGPYAVWTKWGVSDNVLCAGNDDVLTFLDNVFDEIKDIFPSRYIHIGGDECPKTRWEKCPKCQARIREKGLKADATHTKEQMLQGYVMQHVSNYLKQYGRKVIGWDEILEGKAVDGTTVMSWRGEHGGIQAARSGHDVIMTPNSYMYFDFYQSQDTSKEPLAIGGYIPIDAVYGYDPVPSTLTQEEKKHILGVQANLWTEYIPTFSHVQYMVLPRWAALAEVQWTETARKDYDDFLQRLPHLMELYSECGYNYARHLYNLSGDFVPDTLNGTVHAILKTLGNVPVHYTIDGTEPTESSPAYTGPVEIDHPLELRAIALRKEGNSEPFSQVFAFNKATAKPVTFACPPNKRYEAKGAETLVDGVLGNSTYGSGLWVGFSDGNAMEATVDLKDDVRISSVKFNTCVTTADGVFDARKAKVEISANGVAFIEVVSQAYPAIDKETKEIRRHELSFAPQEARYVRLTVIPETTIPSWNWLAGAKAFVFIDEIIVE